MIYALSMVSIALNVYVWCVMLNAPDKVGRWGGVMWRWAKRRRG